MSDPVPLDRRGTSLLDELTRRPAPSAAEPFDRLRALLPGRPSQGLLAVGAVLVAVAVVAALVVLRRPRPVESLLPMAAPAAGGALPPPTAGAAAPVPTSAPAGPVVVHVAGAVVRPGVVEVPAGSRVADAVELAGGLRPGADPDRVNLAAPLADGERVVVPLVGQVVPPVLGGSGTGPGGAAARDGGAGEGSAAPVDLNTADAAALEELPGVGPATAAAIVEHRESVGAFTGVDELLDVRGIGEARLEQLRDLVTVGP